MNKQAVVYNRIASHDKLTINQDDLTDAYIDFTGENITNREVRQIIADCIAEKTFLILSTPKRPGGYFLPINRYEGIACADRLESQGIKLICKARNIREINDRLFPEHEMEQMDLPCIARKVE